MKKILLLVLIVIVSKVNATVDTAVIYSAAMHKNIKAVVIKPDNYKKRNLRFPVLYLLHGYSGKYSTWLIKAPELQALATANQVIIVCPDGGFSSWYFDSPIDSNYKYETHVAVEVPAFIDSAYKTIANRQSRAITGFSMGGHGGLFLGFRHSATFASCGSMSGGVDLNDTKRSYDILKRLKDSSVQKLSVLAVVQNKPTDSLAIIIDCGVSDFFYNNNKTLHQQLLQQKVAHDYIERPGKHDWVYWGNAIQYQMLFFRREFNKYVQPL